MAAGFIASLTFVMISLAENDRSLGLWSFVLAGMILGVSVLMVSNVRYPSFKKIDLKTKVNVWTLLGFALLLGLIVKWTIYTSAAIFVVYLVLPLFLGRKKKAKV
jgi:CDP-diacylglycerol--serine O-phosphatidyltransferase